MSRYQYDLLSSSMSRPIQPSPLVPQEDGFGRRAPQMAANSPYTAHKALSTCAWSFLESHWQEFSEWSVRAIVFSGTLWAFSLLVLASHLGRPPWPRPITFTSSVVFEGQACKPGPRVPSREPGRAPLVFQNPRLTPSSVHDPLTVRERHK